MEAVVDSVVDHLDGFGLIYLGGVPVEDGESHGPKQRAEIAQLSFQNLR